MVQRLSGDSAAPLELTIQAQPARQQGTYTLSGTANLPDQSRIIIQGIRNLELSDQDSSSAGDDTNGAPGLYSILDRQTAEVNQGKWQTTLTLWQVAPDGAYQEAWQMNQTTLGLSVRSSTSVTFLATFDPAVQAATLIPALRKLENQLGNSRVQFTQTGGWYLEAEKTLALALPTGRTVPPSRSEAKPSTAFDRSAESTSARPEPPPLLPEGQQQSTAPLSVRQQLN
jgi:hypothetical protein